MIDNHKPQSFVILIMDHLNIKKPSPNQTTLTQNIADEYTTVLTKNCPTGANKMMYCLHMCIYDRVAHIA